MKIPIDVQIAYVDQIEAAAQGWRDGVKTYCDFMEELSQMALNIYKAGAEYKQNYAADKNSFDTKLEA